MNTQPARGMRDFLPEDLRRREYVIKMIRAVYERFGFEPLETPACENIETLQGKYGEEGNQLIFKILKRGEHEASGQADLALRYDLTVPLARVVAEYADKLPKFFKRYQIQPVWRADRPARGRFREFYQCDVDAIGSRSMIVEAELIAAASEALRELGFTNFTVRLNHRGLLTGVLTAAGVEADKQTDALVALDKLDKIGRAGVEKEFAARGIAMESGARLLGFFEDLQSLEKAAEFIEPLAMEATDATASGFERDGNDGMNNSAATIASGGDAQLIALNLAVLGRLVEFIGAHEAGARAVEEMRTILDYSLAADQKTRIKLDPTLARGLSYYTGAIMEINVPDLAGSLGGGGRYDELVGMFSKQSVPACGFSLGLERIIVVMQERGMFPTDLESRSADVMVTVWDEASIASSLALASELRKSGLRVDVYPEADKLAKQFKYAAQRGVPFVAVVGDDERARSEVSLKDMQTGEQTSLPRGEVATRVTAKLNQVG